MTVDTPKSAYELAMERLKAKDKAEGADSVELSAAQIEAIAEARQDYEAKLAECKILHQSQMAVTADPAAREELAAHYRRDLSNLGSDRDKKIARIRDGSSAS